MFQFVVVGFCGFIQLIHTIYDRNFLNISMQENEIGKEKLWEKRITLIYTDKRLIYSLFSIMKMRQFWDFDFLFPKYLNMLEERWKFFLMQTKNICFHFNLMWISSWIHFCFLGWSRMGEKHWPSLEKTKSWITSKIRFPSDSHPSQSEISRNVTLIPTYRIVFDLKICVFL